MTRETRFQKPADAEKANDSANGGLDTRPGVRALGLRVKIPVGQG